MSVDSPSQNAAMVEKLSLPFPFLSDPDRTAVIGRFELADPVDRRNIAVPAVVVLAPGGGEVYRYTGRDFADRPVEDEVVAAVGVLGLPPTSQALPEVIDPQPGPEAMPLHGLPFYFRGARFAAVALARRFPEIGEEAGRYIAQMDRYREAAEELKTRRRDGLPLTGKD